MELADVARQVGEALLARRLMLATAESCTGGWIAQAITSVSGSSQWFERGFVTYSNLSKTEMLGVEKLTLERFGAVSEETVRAMAQGALARSHAQVSVAVSGIAGPTGGTPDKPVGTVWIAWGFEDIKARRFHFQGDRQAVRRQAVEEALRGVLATLG